MHISDGLIRWDEAIRVVRLFRRCGTTGNSTRSYIPTVVKVDRTGVRSLGCRRTLAGYLSYYHDSRTHLSLAKDALTPRRVQAVTGDVIAVWEVGGLHHRYERRVA
jgi:hypothetical protein